MRKQEIGVRRGENVKGKVVIGEIVKNLQNGLDFRRRNLKKERSRNEPREGWVVLDRKER